MTALRAESYRMNSLNEQTKNPSFSPAMSPELQAQLKTATIDQLDKLAKEWTKKIHKTQTALSKLPKKSEDYEETKTLMEQKIASLQNERLAIATEHEKKVNQTCEQVATLQREFENSCDVSIGIDAWATMQELIAQTTSKSWEPTYYDVADEILARAERVGVQYYAQKIKDNVFDIVEVREGAITYSHIVQDACRRVYPKATITTTQRELTKAITDQLQVAENLTGVTRVITSPGELEANNSCITSNNIIIHYENLYAEDGLHATRELAIYTSGSWREQGKNPFLHKLDFCFDATAWVDFCVACKGADIKAQREYVWSKLPKKCQDFLSYHLDGDNLWAVLEASGNFLCPCNQTYKGLRALWFFLGEHATGKSTWLSLLNSLCPKWVSTISPCSTRFADPLLAKGVRRIGCEEGKIEVLDQATVKLIASGARPEVETKGKDTIGAQDGYSIACVVCSNNAPRFGRSADDDALKTRLVKTYWRNTYTDGSTIWHLNAEERNQTYEACLMALQLALWHNAFTRPQNADDTLSAESGRITTSFVRLWEPTTQDNATPKREVMKLFISWLRQQGEPLEEYCVYDRKNNSYNGIKQPYSISLWRELTDKFPTYREKATRRDTLLGAMYNGQQTFADFI